MQLRPLGSSGLHVSQIGLGGMPLSIAGRPGAKSEAIKVIHASLRAGVTLIDTADVYCLDQSDIGHNEKLIAEALAQLRRRRRGAGGDQGRAAAAGRGVGDRRAPAAPAVGVRGEPEGAAADDAAALSAARGRRRGAARGQRRGAGGAAAAGEDRPHRPQQRRAAELKRALAVAPIVSVQNRCSVFDRRDFSNGLLALCAAENIAYLAYSPVGGGRGKARVAEDATLKAVGGPHGVSPFQVALAWLLAKSPVIIPIPGASQITSAIDSAAAAPCKLDADDMAALDRAFPV
jgi:aryl-alcohol dehydrogenase-like predicted oxidoreductase